VERCGASTARERETRAGVSVLTGTASLKNEKTSLAGTHYTLHTLTQTNTHVTTLNN